MTFRDKSADVTLDNANEGIMRTKYARSDPRNPDPKGDFARRARLEAEIDALKMELIELRSELVKSGMERLALMDEVASLKENAKIYKWADAAMKDSSTTQKEEECDK